MATFMLKLMLPLLFLSMIPPKTGAAMTTEVDPDQSTDGQLYFVMILATMTSFPDRNYE
ncbi:hypothetical protein E2542_SST21935 [Spatholobus suberectus]|nr:hypothetical protein E2542_SST21935 [Spatholobus suberectus]